MESLAVRVTGFETSGGYTAYATDVRVGPAAAWTVAIRYSAFHAFYQQLVALEAEFAFEFPKKGGFFSSPPPEERQPQLDAFVQAVVAHFEKRAFPSPMRALLDELLEITQHAPNALKERAAAQEEAAETASESAESGDDKADERDAVVEHEQEQEPQPEAAVQDEPEVSSVTEDKADALMPETAVGESEEATEPKQEAVPVEAQDEEVASTPAEVLTKPVAVAEVPAEAIAVVTPPAKSPVAEPAAPAAPSPVVTPAAPVAKAALAVERATTKTTDTGETIQELTFSNGMTLKKKKLSAEQKRLRNMRRKEKRKKNSGMKVRGAKTHQTTDGASTEEDDSEAD